MKNKLFRITIIALLSASIFSCSKDSVEELDEETNTIIDADLKVSTSTTMELNDVDQPNERLASQPSYQNIYYFYTHGDHFYTTNYQEGINAGYTYRGILGKTILSNSYQLTRWYNIQTGERWVSNNVLVNQGVWTNMNDQWHCLTNNNVYLCDLPNGQIPGTNVTGSSAFPGGDWRYEGVLGKDGGTVNIHSYYKASAKERYYTNDYSDLGGGNSEWVYEGVKFKLYN